MGTPVQHQTVRLTAGSHRSPADGACVMEVASMLAGERFSDRPRCVSPVVAAYLRTYNDLIGDGHRHDLYRVAAKVVGSRVSERAELLRAEHARRLALELAGERTGWRRWLPWPDPRSIGLESAGDALADAVVRLGPSGHARAMALVDELLWGVAPTLGARERDAAVTASPPRRPQPVAA